MLVLIGTGVGALLLGAILGYTVGLSKGKQAKLDELHLLQDEGWLTITYVGNEQSQLNHAHRGVRKGGDRDERIDGLMLDDVPTHARTRRDDPERRDDWAQAIQQTRKAHIDDDVADVSGDDEPHGDE